jgi:hypothetical protein
LSNGEKIFPIPGEHTSHEKYPIKIRKLVHFTRWIRPGFTVSFQVIMTMKEKSAVTEYRSYCRWWFTKKMKKCGAIIIRHIAANQMEDPTLLSASSFHARDLLRF